MCLSEPWAPGSLPCGSGPLLPPYISQESEAPRSTAHAGLWRGWGQRHLQTVATRAETLVLLASPYRDSSSSCPWV